MLAVLGCASADGTYFVRIFLVWIFARLNPELAPKPQGHRVSVRGLYPHPSDGSEHSHSRNSSLSAASKGKSRDMIITTGGGPQSLIEIPEISDPFLSDNS